MPVTGTFTANVAASMLQRYPDISPYDMKPIPENVVPSYATANCKPANRSKLASYRLKNGVNAINIHGDNPYTVPQAEAPSSSLPLTEHRRVGSLTDAIVGDALVFLEQVATSRNAISFKIRLGEEVRLIKIFHSAAHNALSRERRAYAYLMDSKVHERGAVLKCYGSLTLSVPDLAGIQLAANLSPDAAALARSQLPLEALLFEYRPNAIAITVENVDRAMATAAMRALYDIHSAHVLHGSVRSGLHVYLDSQGAFWVNFEDSKCDEDASMDRQMLFKELEGGWNYFFSQMIPDKFLGITTRDLLAAEQHLGSFYRNAILDTELLSG